MRTFAPAFRGPILLAAATAELAFASPALAIETGQPPALPPAPPPPLQPAPTAPAAARPSPAPAPAQVSVATSPAPSEPEAPSAEAPSTTGTSSFDTRWFVAPMLGYLSDDLGFGLGLRGGKTLDNHIYLGGTFVYQVGRSGTYAETVTTPSGTQSVGGSWSSSGFYVGPEGGYDFDLRPIVVRPYLGLGLFSWTASVSAPGGGASGSSTQVVLWPGCSVLWSVPGSSLFVGGDARVVSVPGAAFGVYAMGGVHFGG